MLLYNCAGQILGDDSLSGTAAGRGVNDRFKLLKMIRSISTTTQGGTVSLTFTFALYVSHNSVGLFIQRCSRERAADPHPFWGCIMVSDPLSVAPISKHEESLAKYKAVLKKLPPPIAMEKSKDWTMLDDPIARDPPYEYNTEDKKEIIRYGKDYLSNVVYFLDKLVLNPGMLFI
jgi:hypothetical protein